MIATQIFKHCAFAEIKRSKIIMGSPDLFQLGKVSKIHTYQLIIVKTERLKIVRCRKLEGRQLIIAAIQIIERGARTKIQTL